MKAQKQPSKLRIIGGRWGGRKLTFLPLPGLRPTPDRIRETLFNWLAPVIEGSRCLDLFAGSGALGIEALSRGAKEVVMIDQDASTLQQIQSTLELLNANNAKLYQAHAPDGLSRLSSATFDIVFLDPPFRQQLIAPCCQCLEQQGWLAPNAYIYIEAEKELTPLPIPENWQILRSKKAGQVGYYLVRRGGR